jgi:ppGpp synthetase/RelA/SpoT-type nucleotidyltranferase
MQDIAGLRIVVPLIEQQNDVVEQVVALFDGATVVDRREKPSHGYRAVHVIVLNQGVPVEVQVRTELQHRWAELSEKLSDLVDPAIKYGGGNPATVRILHKISSTIANGEQAQEEVERYGRELRESDSTDQRLLERVEASRVRLRTFAAQFVETLDVLLEDLRTASRE